MSFDRATAPPDPARAAEERDKDFVTFRLGARRRLWSTLLIGGMLIGGEWIGLADVPLALELGLFVVGTAGNRVLVAIATNPRLYRWWFRYVFATFDVALISAVVFAFGDRGLAALYFLAIVPYSFDHGRALGYFAAAASAAGFALGAWGHHLWNPAAPFLPMWVGLTAAAGRGLGRRPAARVGRGAERDGGAAGGAGGAAEGGRGEVRDVSSAACCVLRAACCVLRAACGYQAIRRSLRSTVIPSRSAAKDLLSRCMSPGSGG
ncbi:MAG TPA: hypothetical protein VKA84_11335 [Gemmatimonadaceae bacterium]|nr:hypothetical protein [Gemmatimonadaceae bacterium]